MQCAAKAMARRTDTGGGAPLGHAFCDVCGSIMRLPGQGPAVVCTACQHTHLYEAPADVHSQSNMRVVFGVKQKKIGEHDADQRPTVERNCDGCGNKEMVFSTAQLRSVDEGQTIFYECLQCGHRETINS
eukprot:TRINITY_DN9734_c0_g1_i1.p1 TRINITY_DN9734_c0_g1~~TRINITY_DN9734_c0_g1_i1.p1  ORF type:complete len:130 (+),score=32.33 TRINITY_DN9734_c0_g1_i1:172-561(+)